MATIKKLSTKYILNLKYNCDNYYGVLIINHKLSCQNKNKISRKIVKKTGLMILDSWHN